MNTIPTIQQLNDNILANIEAGFSITLDPAQKAFFTVFTAVWAGVLYLIYLAIAQLQKNLWVDLCDYPTLLRYGTKILGRSPFQATAGQYIINIIATAPLTFPANTVFKSNDTSRNPDMLFRNTTAVVFIAGSNLIPVRAFTGGAISRLNVGDTMTLTAPHANVNAAATVTAEVVVPIDAEGWEEYRAKALEKMRLIAGSWNAADYRLNGLPITGVKQIYAYTKSGAANEVNVFVEGEVRGTIPSAAPSVVAAVKAVIDLLFPLGVHAVNYDTCASRAIDVTITMGSFPEFTTAQKTYILTQLTNFINSLHPFIAACDAVSGRSDTLATFNLDSTISIAVPGYGFSGATFTVDLVSYAVFVFDNGDVPYLNSVVYA